MCSHAGVETPPETSELETPPAEKDLRSLLGPTSSTQQSAREEEDHGQSQPVAPSVPASTTPSTNTVGPRFLVVRFMSSFSVDDCEECLKGRTPVYEQHAHVFYETDSQAVAEELVTMFQRDKDHGGGELQPPIPLEHGSEVVCREFRKSEEELHKTSQWASRPPLIGVVNAMDLDLPQRVLCLQALANIKGDISGGGRGVQQGRGG